MTDDLFWKGKPLYSSLICRVCLEVNLLDTLCGSQDNKFLRLSHRLNTTTDRVGHSALVALGKGEHRSGDLSDLLDTGDTSFVRSHDYPCAGVLLTSDTVLVHNTISPLEGVQRGAREPSVTAV